MKNTIYKNTRAALNIHKSYNDLTAQHGKPDMIAVFDNPDLEDIFGVYVTDFDFRDEHTKIYTVYAENGDKVGEFERSASISPSAADAILRELIIDYCAGGFPFSKEEIEAAHNLVLFAKGITAVVSATPSF